MLLYGRNQHNIVKIKNQPNNQPTKTPESDDPTKKKHVFLFADLFKTPECSASWPVGFRRNLMYHHQISFIINHIVRKFSRKMLQCLYSVLEVYLGHKREIVNRQSNYPKTGLKK